MRLAAILIIYIHTLYSNYVLSHPVEYHPLDTELLMSDHTLLNCIVGSNRNEQNVYLELRGYM